MEHNSAVGEATVECNGKQSDECDKVSKNECNNECGVDARSQSAPNTPTKSLSLDLALRKGHRVNFPEDNMIVSGYFEAPDPYHFGMNYIRIRLIIIITISVIKLTAVHSLVNYERN